jgi:hypothetical protein
MQKVTPFLWFDGQAEQAARFYVSLLPDSRIERVTRAPADTPSGPAGMVLTVEFTLSGTRFIALNGGPMFRFTEAVSFQKATSGDLVPERPTPRYRRCIVPENQRECDLLGRRLATRTQKRVAAGGTF